MAEFSRGRLSSEFSYIETQIFKAVDPDTHKIAGFSCWTLATGNEVDPTPTGKIVRQMPPSMNKEFIVTVGSEIEQPQSHMEGEKHYCNLVQDQFVRLRA
ncbi:hypothetical protein SCAR479_02892 [Seiridium cardinale]|uniref:Uncharacterized protein n=1 Tax=Seiridium cardinale TaxID=138064 RepID=A0ABR2Y2F0_9PEZI